MHTFHCYFRNFILCSFFCSATTISFISFILSSIHSFIHSIFVAVSQLSTFFSFKLIYNWNISFSISLRKFSVGLFFFLSSSLMVIITARDILRKWMVILRVLLRIKNWKKNRIKIRQNQKKKTRPCTINHQQILNTRKKRPPRYKLENVKCVA